MKKFIFLSVYYLISISVTAQTTNPAPYCMSGYTSTSSFPEISKVEVTSPTGTVITNVSNHTPAPGYTYYNNLAITNMYASYNHSLKVTFKNVDMETMLKAWIDYDNDLVYESNELIMSIPQGSVGTGMAVVKQSSFVPITAGPTRMRVSLGWHYANWSSSTFKLDSCHVQVAGDGSAGETEDYDLDILPPLNNLPELANKASFLVFPNPSHTEVNVLDELAQKTKEYEIIDGLGRVILRSQTFPINVSELEKDIYCVKFSFKNGTVLRTKLLVD